MEASGNRAHLMMGVATAGGGLWVVVLIMGVGGGAMVVVVIVAGLRVAVLFAGMWVIVCFLLLSIYLVELHTDKSW
jgi:hypothetical protein